jgi:hypothetical protein
MIIIAAFHPKGYIRGFYKITFRPDPVIGTEGKINTGFL